VTAAISWAAFPFFPACPGLLGLTLLAAVNRSKEIGVRKVPDTHAQDIIKLLSKKNFKTVMDFFSHCITISMVFYE